MRYYSDEAEVPESTDILVFHVTGHLLSRYCFLKCMVAAFTICKNQQMAAGSNCFCSEGTPFVSLSAGIRMKNSPSASICVNKNLFV